MKISPISQSYYCQPIKRSHVQNKQNPNFQGTGSSLLGVLKSAGAKINSSAPWLLPLLSLGLLGSKAADEALKKDGIKDTLYSDDEFAGKERMLG